MTRCKRHNPKLNDWIKWGVIGAAGYGAYTAYKQIRGGDDTPADTRTPYQRCVDEGGVWVPYPTYLPDDTGTAGYCVK